jgi:hypothetical protein
MQSEDSGGIVVEYHDGEGLHRWTYQYPVWLALVSAVGGADALFGTLFRQLQPGQQVIVRRESFDEREWLGREPLPAKDPYRDDDYTPEAINRTTEQDDGAP